MPTGRERPGEHWNARLIREQAEASRQSTALVAKAWSEAKAETVRMLRGRAAEHERIAGLGGQSSEQMQRRLAEMHQPTYAQQAIAERALAEQIAALLERQESGRATGHHRTP